MWKLAANSDIMYIYIFASMGLFILLIVCINFMNLSTARSAHRAQEVGIRKVLGAYRSQLIRQFVGESLLLSIIALLVAVGLVYLLLPLFNTLSGKQLTMAYDSIWMVPALIGITLGVGFVAGGYPAFFLSSFRPVVVLQGALKAGASNALMRKILSFVVGAPIVYYGMNLWLQEFPYQVDLNPVMFILAGLAALIISWRTVGYQALKTAMTNPADALQYE